MAPELLSAVVAALADPPPGEGGTVEAMGVEWSTSSWGEEGDPPLMLLHGVTSNGATWWRVGPALAASGRRVVALDMPGHGRTAAGQRSPLFAVTAAQLAGFTRAAGLARPDLSIVAHSWGAMVAAHLPAAGVRPRTLVLLDPPVLKLAQLMALAHDPTERRYASLETASVAVRAANPTWSDGDIAAKTEALTEFDEDFVRSVLLENGAWDGGMAALRHPDAEGVPVWIIRGESAMGGLIPDPQAIAFESQLGPGHVVTITGGGHSPQRTHPEVTLLAILGALGTS
jgi:pimeloyl-ACP methyl ester carboxylesterase